MIVRITISGFYVNKPIVKEVFLNPEDSAVQLPNGEILKVKQLKKEALDQYFYEKYIKDTGIEGRIIKVDYEMVKS